MEADAFFSHALGQPVMLVEVNAGREREVRADADEHAAELGVIDVEVELIDPTARELEMAGAVFLADAREDAGWFSSLDNADDLIGLRLRKVGLHELVASPFRVFQNRSVPAERTVGDPVLILVGNVAKHIPGHRVDLTKILEEIHNPHRFVERLDRGIDQDTIEAAVMKTDVILMMLVEGVHGGPPGLVGSRHRKDTSWTPLPFQRGIMESGRPEPRASDVRRFGAKPMSPTGGPTRSLGLLTFWLHILPLYDGISRAAALG